MQDWRSTLSQSLCEPFRGMVLGIPDAWRDAARELRVRVGQPVVLLGRGELPLEKDYKPTTEDCHRLLVALCGHSLYAHEAQMREGYLTLRGGFRVGLAGRAVRGEAGLVRLSPVSGLNIRVAREIPGAAQPLLPYVLRGNAARSALILSPPGMGKTTVLRDLIRLLSLAGQGVCVADERGEIAASHNGVATMDLGPRTDVIENCPKAQAMLLLLRGMAPQVIATDEIGTREEALALAEISASGAAVIATAHAAALEDARLKKGLAELLDYFPCAIVLGGAPGRVVGIYERGKPLRGAS